MLLGSYRIECCVVFSYIGGSNLGKMLAKKSRVTKDVGTVEAEAEDVDGQHDFKMIHWSVDIS